MGVLSEGEMTYGEFERLITERVSQAEDKRLVMRAIEASSQFFGECGMPKSYRGAHTHYHKPWDQGSDYIHWDREVTIPLDVTGATKISIRHYDFGRYGVNEGVTIKLIRNDHEQIVLKANSCMTDRNGKLREHLDPLRVCGEWYYESYIPDDFWEELLEGEKLKRCASGYSEWVDNKHKEETLAAEKARLEAKRAKPITTQEWEVARNFGISK